MAARAIGKVQTMLRYIWQWCRTLARTSGMSVAQAKGVIEGYWKLNWSVKAIAEDQCVVKDDYGKMWLVNPVNGLLTPSEARRIVSQPCVKEREVISLICGLMKC